NSITQGSNAIRNKAIFGPIPAPNDVARAGGTQADTMSVHPVRRKVGLPPRRDQQFASSLACAIGVIAAHRVRLAKRTSSAWIFVAFVRGNDLADMHATDVPDCFQDVDGSENIDVPGFPRFPDTTADEGLCGEVKNNPRLGFSHQLFHGPGVADIADRMRRQNLLDSGVVEQAWPGGWRKREPVNLSTQLLEPQA